MYRYIIAILLIIASFIGGYFSHRPETIEIIKHDIKTNYIDKDVYNMPYTEAMEALSCFYTAFYDIDIKQSSGDEYLLTSKLCDREASRVISIRQKQYNNIITGGIFIDNDLNRGLRADYLRLYGRFVIGGGIMGCSEYFNLSVSGGYRF